MRILRAIRNGWNYGVVKTGTWIGSLHSPAMGH
jgi:hypothetical protein